MKRVTFVKSLFAIALLVAAALGVFQVAPAEAGLGGCPTRPGCATIGPEYYSDCIVCCAYDCPSGIQYGPPCQVVC